MSMTTRERDADQLEEYCLAVDRELRREVAEVVLAIGVSGLAYEILRAYLAYESAGLVAENIRARAAEVRAMVAGCAAEAPMGVI